MIGAPASPAPESDRRAVDRPGSLVGRSPELAALLARLPPPIVVFNKSHSGSRLTAKLLAAGGVFMGAHQHSTRDAWDMVPLVRYLVLRHYPDYGPALAGEDAMLADMIRAAIERHLEGYDAASGRRWGWKLCETTFILPVIAACFPAAHFVHLVRDGRDVAFSDHIGPTEPFWKKIFFGTDAIDHWRGLPLTGRAYRRQPHIFNAQHWVASVTAGRTYGRALGDRYLELRYEAICGAWEATAERLFAFLGLGSPAAALASFGESVDHRSIGRFRRQPAHKRQAVLALVRPLQSELGYPLTDV